MIAAKIVDGATLVRWTRDFIRFPSPQSSLFEQDTQVQAFLGGPVTQRLDACSLPWRRDAMGNVIVEIGPTDAGPSLMLMAYAMTHPANRMQDAFSGEEIEGGSRVRGRGASEQKGALAAAIAATFAARDLPLKGRLVLAISAAGETGRHDAAHCIIDAVGHVPTATIIAIGTGGRLALANKGRIDIEVTVRGRAAHSSTPEAGVDAITGARRVLDRVLALDVSGHKHPHLGAATLTATALRSWPEATHTVQDEVHIVFDRRLLPGEDIAPAFGAIATAADIGAPWQVDTVLGPTMFPAEIDAEGSLARAVREGCRAQGLPAPSSFYSSGALDAGLLHAKGMEAAMWGPGNMDLWHTENESISVDELIIGAKGYLGVIQSYLG